MPEYYLKPSSKGLQKPQDVSKVNGQSVNNPTYPEFGGFTGASKAADKNAFNIVPPGRG